MRCVSWPACGHGVDECERPEKARKGLTRTAFKPRPASPMVQRKRSTLVQRKPMRWTPDPPTDEEIVARRLVKERAEDRCELGITCSGAALGVDYSHRIGRGVGGPWSAANSGWACRSCHSYLHQWPAEARVRTGWMLRSTDDFLTFPVYHSLHGWVLLLPDGSGRPTQSRPEAA